MSQVWKHIVNEYPRFSTALFPPPGSSPLSLSQLCEALPQILDAGEGLFPLNSRKAQAQLWFYSFLNSVLGPAAFAMVEYEQVPRLSLLETPIHLHPDTYWVSWQSAGLEEFSLGVVKQAGTDLAESCAPLVATLGALVDVRPAPLWALVADGLRQSALEAGNEAFDPALGVSIARALSEGLARAGVEVPESEYRQVAEGEFVSAEGNLVSDDAVVFADRVSCCMIYRCEKAGICASCPRRPAKSRDAGLLSHAAALRM